jgi:hypothetical protein
MQTLRNLIFVYAFGDKIGQLRISGLAFAGACGYSSGRTGVENVLEYYAVNRISNRLTPCQLQIGSSPAGYFEGYLTDLRLDILQPEARMTQFTLDFQVFPEAIQ